MSAATLASARASIRDDRQFVSYTLCGRFGARERDAAAEAMTTAQSMPEPDEHDYVAVADLTVETLTQWELGEMEERGGTA